MPAVRKPLLVLMLALSSGGCFTNRINTVMNSWVGHHYSDLLMSWGPPHSVYQDGQGGYVLVWAADRRYTTPGRAVTTTTASGYARTTYNSTYLSGRAQSYTTYTPPQTSGYTAYRMFRVDSRGIIYNWAWRGL